MSVSGKLYTAYLISGVCMVLLTSTNAVPNISPCTRVGIISRLRGHRVARGANTGATPAPPRSHRRAAYATQARSVCIRVEKCVWDES